MWSTIENVWGILFSLGLMLVVVTRFILILRLYAIKDSKIFDKTVEGELLGFMASQTLPFKIENDEENPKANRVINILNKLKAAYWLLMLSLLCVLVIKLFVKA